MALTIACGGAGVVGDLGFGDTVGQVRIVVGAVLGPWGPFLETPGNLTGPKSYFEIRFSRKVGCVLTSNEVYFVSLADNFTVQFSNLLNYYLE